MKKQRKYTHYAYKKNYLLLIRQKKKNKRNFLKTYRSKIECYCRINLISFYSLFNSFLYIKKLFFAIFSFCLINQTKTTTTFTTKPNSIKFLIPPNIKNSCNNI